CYTVVPAVGMKMQALSVLVDGWQARAHILQIEFIAGDEAIALTVRHLVPLAEADRPALAAFGREHGFAIFLQPKGVDSVHPLEEPAPVLSFRLPQWDVELASEPLDFMQVNAGLNQKMIALALELLDTRPEHRVLDLFCGLGNFTLPLARQVREVVGVEGDAGLVARDRKSVV